MTVGARVLFGSTTVQLPARTDYEREILFEYVHDATHRHGQVQLRAGKRSCLLRPARRAAGAECRNCGCHIRVVVCELAGSTLCMPCLWRDVMNSRPAARAARPKLVSHHV